MTITKISKRVDMKSEKVRACIVLRDALAPVTQTLFYVLGLKTIAGDGDNSPLSMIDNTPIKEQLAKKYCGEDQWRTAFYKRRVLDKDLFARVATGVTFSRIKDPQIAIADIEELLAWYREHQAILMPGEAGEEALQRLSRAIDEGRKAGLLVASEQKLRPVR